MDEYSVVMEAPTRRYECLCYIPTVAVTIWVGLSFNLKGPRCYVHEFYVPALDLSLTNYSSAVNPCIFFDVSFKNILSDRSLRYGGVNLTFSYPGNGVVANYTVPGFRQGKGKTAHRRDVVETRGVPWDRALGAVSNGSAAVFRVELAARPRFRFWFWYSKKKGVRNGADVAVDGSGMKVKKGDIRLNSADSNTRIPIFIVFPCLLLTTSFLYSSAHPIF